MSGTTKTINDILDELQTIIFRISEKRCITMVNNSELIKVKPESVRDIKIDNYVEFDVNDDSDLFDLLASNNIINDNEKIILAGKIINVYVDAETKDTYVELYNPDGIYKNFYENAMIKMLGKVYKILHTSEKLATNTDLFFDFDIEQDQYLDECGKIISELKNL